MTFDDFKIGDKFWTGTGRWLCIDKGTVYVLAVKCVGDFVDDAVQVFDPLDFDGCWQTMDDYVFNTKR